MKRLFINCALLFLFSGSLYAAEINVAVASNFRHALQKLAADFKVKTGHDLVISSASTGKLYSQIVHGAPYDVFLSADEKRPDRLIKENKADANSAYVYALGKLVLLSRSDDFSVCREILVSDQLKHIAMANPKIAPYGVAAQQVLQNLGLWQQLLPRIVNGENVAQAAQFVITKNAEAGFVAASVIDQMVPAKTGCSWTVPAAMYSPIKQKAVLLKQAENKVPAQDFIKYIQSIEAKNIIRSAGYDVL